MGGRNRDWSPFLSPELLPVAACPSRQHKEVPAKEDPAECAGEGALHNLDVEEAEVTAGS